MKEDSILVEIEAVNDYTDIKVVQSIYNRLMFYNTSNGANKEVFEAARKKRIL